MLKFKYGVNKYYLFQILCFEGEIEMQYVSPMVDFTTLNTVEDEAWFLIFVAVLLGLGASVVLGAAVWCMVQGKGSFTGGVKWANGLEVKIECK